MASILGGELVKRLGAEPTRYGCTLAAFPRKPRPFHYQLVFSVEGLINEYVEPARILRKGKLVTIEPLTEPEQFHMSGFSPLVAFHTSGGTSTLPESFGGKVGECFEKTVRYPGHYDLLCELKELGLFSSRKMKVNGAEITPRAVMSKIFEGKFASNGPDVCIMRLEAHESVSAYGVRGLLGGRLKGHVATFTLVEMEKRGIRIQYALERWVSLQTSVVSLQFSGIGIRRTGRAMQNIRTTCEPKTDD